MFSVFSVVRGRRGFYPPVIMVCYGVSGVFPSNHLVGELYETKSGDAETAKSKNLNHGGCPTGFVAGADRKNFGTSVSSASLRSKRNIAEKKVAKKLSRALIKL